VKADPASRARPAKWKGVLYRQARDWHGYLSAFAFLALIFFALTGLLLNHPEWFAGRPDPASKDVTVQLAPAELAAARKAKDPARAFADVVGAKTHLVGGFQSGEIVDDQVMLRFESPKGASDVTVDLATGAAEVTVTKARLIDLINELHRGKNAGKTWKAVIDASAILVLALSVIGYVLFFTLRFRLRTSLILTGVSLGALLLVIVFLTP
jgi:hypothetical protein